MAPKTAVLQLPINVATKIDVGRLLREAEMLDDFLRQAAIRTPGSPMALPRTSQLMEELAQLNSLNILNAEERQRLIGFLRQIKSDAPTLHMSFSADPSPLFLKRLITWLRQQIHPQLILQVGLQPTLGAGCIVRTSNKYFDFSLRNHFFNNKSLLISYLTENKPLATEAEPSAVPNSEVAS